MKRLGPAILLLLALPITKSIAADATGVVIDPGHSLRSPGAVGCTGRTEYGYNYDLAAAMVRMLKERQVAVVLSHGYREERSLAGRAQSAAGKRLLLSVHHDSVQPQSLTWKSGRPSSTTAEGFSIFVSRNNMQYEASVRFARALGKGLVRRGLIPNPYHSQAIPGENRKYLVPELGIYLYDDLAVLKGAPVPALLLEAGVIVNPRDEQRVAQEVYRQSIAAAVCEMLDLDK